MNEEIVDLVRKAGLVSGEKRFLAIETLKGVMDFIQQTKPSNLMLEQEGYGKDKSTRAVVDEPQMRNLWTKWADMTTDVIYNKAALVPGLLMDDIIKVMKMDGNAPKA